MSSQVSVIIPCYNQSKFLAEAIESVLRQTHSQLECIIINDGSTDSTDDVAKNYIKKDNRVKYVRKNNGGLANARNIGLQSASGDFIQFLDADDVLAEDKLEKQVQLISINDAQVCICDYKKIDYLSKAELRKGLRSFPDEENSLKDFLMNWENSLSVPCHCFLLKKEFLEKYQLRFNETLPNHEDWAFWIEVLMLKPKLVFLHEQLCTYNLSFGSMSADRKLMYKGFKKAINYIDKKHRTTNEIDLQRCLALKRKTIKEIYKPRKNSVRKMRRRILRRVKRLYKKVGKNSYEGCDNSSATL